MTRHCGTQGAWSALNEGCVTNTVSSHAVEQSAAVSGDMTPGSLCEVLIEEIGIGIIVCDGSGAMRLVNRCAENELACGTLLRRMGQTLTAGGVSRPSLEGALGAGGRKCCPQLVELSHGSDRMLLSVVPLPPSAARVPLTMLVLGGRQICSSQGLELLSTVHGLTNAERRVLADLLQERTPREIALAHGVALTTVRTQIASIESKFGVHSVEALVCRAAALPPLDAEAQDGPPSSRTSCQPTGR